MAFEIQLDVLIIIFQARLKRIGELEKIIDTKEE